MRYKVLPSPSEIITYDVIRSFRAQHIRDYAKLPAGSTIGLSNSAYDKLSDYQRDCLQIHIPSGKRWILQANLPEDIDSLLDEIRKA